MFFLRGEQRRDFVEKTICHCVTKDNRDTYAQGAHKEETNSGISELRVQGFETFPARVFLSCSTPEVCESSVCWSAIR